ncbi:sugar ABC transporter permease [Mycoplasma procyoni]|nr:sugar ABC transporter permease [Mycoplasma procyoni]
MIPSILIIILFTLFPFIYSSIQAVSYTPDPNDVTIREFSFQFFAEVLSDQIFAVGVRNSLIYSLLSLPLTLVIAIIVSSAISSLYRKWAKGFWQTVFFLPYITSAIAVSLAFAYMFDHEIGIINKVFGIDTRWLDSGEYGSYNAIFVITSYGVWKNLAFQILIITTAMLGVDKTLYKAASIDGASGIKQFFRITLPSITKTLNFLVTIGILGGIKVFPIALFDNQLAKAQSNGGSTIMLYIYKQVKDGEYGLAGVATIYLFLIGIAFSVILKRGIALVVLVSQKIGERNVLKTIKNSKVRIR